jgi:polysaccharide biosynthesis protein PslG
MKQFIIFAGLLLFFSGLEAQKASNFPLKKPGKVKALHALEIETSRWSIGGETLDRDYADYHAYKSYLGPLGAKRIRLQGGWAKCEQEKGVYDFAWLDAIVDDAIAQGVQPWLQPSYGNPIYPGGGEAILAGGIPTSVEALEAWDRWVEALVARYKDRVWEWEIWNEPDISKRFTAEEFAAFHVRTCDIIKRIQPEARIIALGLAGLQRTEYVSSILDILKDQGKLDYFNVLTFHGYNPVPETSYDAIAALRNLVHSYNPNIEMWQGENGAPSTPLGTAVGAMSKLDWSELTQAKWVLRRMLGDMGNDVDVTSIFQIADMHYKGGDHLKGLNSKGLVKTNPDNSVVGPKPSYFAYQNTASIFSGEIQRIKNLKTSPHHENLQVFGFTKRGTSGNALALWIGGSKPEDVFEAQEINMELSNISWKDPVMVDLLSGEVYGLSKKTIQKKGDKYLVSQIVVGDWPVLIIDKSWLTIE